MAALTHPFQRWPREQRRLALVCIVIVALVPVVGGLAIKPLHEDKTGEGIVEFELAGSDERAAEILDTWRDEGVIDEAKAIQLFDLLVRLIGEPPG